MTIRNLMLPALFTILLAGCGNPPVPHSDARQARELIEHSLDAWQRGDSLDSQQQQSPPVYIAEELWQDGLRLDSYTLEDQAEVVGTNIRFQATLQYHDARGAARARQVKYVVTTVPARTIARVDY